MSSNSKPSKTTAKKKPRAKSKRKRVDWELIEREYRTGLKKQSQLAREHGISEAAISKRAKEKGWKPDLKAAIRRAAEQANLKQNIEKVDAEKAETISLGAQVMEAAVEAEVKPVTALELDADTVEKYSGLIAAILGDHQELAKRLRGASKSLIAEIERALEMIQPAIQELIDTRNVAIAAQKQEVDARRNKKLKKGERWIKPWTQAELLNKRLILLERIVDVKRKTVQPLDRLIQIERQSYGLQDGDGHAVEELNYDNLLREIHGVD